MTDHKTIEDHTPAPWKRYIFSAFLAGLGAFIGFNGGRFMKGNPGQGWSDELSFAIAIGLGGFGLLVTCSALIDPLGRLLTRSDRRRLEPVMKRLLVLQGVTMILAAVMLGAIPVLMPDLLRPDMHVGLFAVIVGLFVAQTVANILLWRGADEFMRRAMVETAAISFWVLQGALFLWAVAERLSLVPALQTWDLMTVMMAVYLILSLLVAWRLGTQG